MRALQGVCTLVVLVGVGACASAPVTDGPDAAVTEETPGLFGEATITPDSATFLAKRRASGRITKAELEREGGVLLYSFDIGVPGMRGITEVHVDARTGAILRVEHER